MTYEEKHNCIMLAAQRLFSLNGFKEDPLVEVIGDWCIEIKNKCLSQHAIDTDVLFAGDRAGTSSPLAGLGATLSFTAYPDAIVRFLQAEDKKSAVNAYQVFSR
jgi:hypothetical protein